MCRVRKLFRPLKNTQTAAEHPVFKPLSSSVYKKGALPRGLRHVRHGDPYISLHSEDSALAAYYVYEESLSEEAVPARYSYIQEGTLRTQALSVLTNPDAPEELATSLPHGKMPDPAAGCIALKENFPALEVSP